MAKKFEELRVWQDARELNRIVYEVAERLIDRRRFGLEGQLTRASLSIMNNIAEGFDRGGNRELGHFLIQAKGSTGEVKSMLYVLLDQGLLDQSTFDSLYQRFDRLGAALHRLIQHIKGSDFDGYSRRGRDQISDSLSAYDVLPDADELNAFWPNSEREN